MDTAMPAGRPSANVSVITVTYNNADGLARTLASLSALATLPREVIVIDGRSADETSAVVERFRARLPLRFVSETDKGIYDAMNKGRAMAHASLVHYLNAGDVVWGDPYPSVEAPSLLRTRICNTDGNVVFEDFVKLFGYGYCHQGMILPREHEPYDTALRIVADLDMVMGTFPGGLAALPINRAGGVDFFLGGVSSSRRDARDREIRQVLYRRLPFLRARMIAVALWLKGRIPDDLRKRIARTMARRSN